MSEFAADVLVIGAGPGGLCAAERLARAGVAVLVCEEHPSVGDPVHCTGIIATESFDEFELPHDASLNQLTTARFVSPSGVSVTYAGDTPLATVIDRPAFDRVLADRAVAAGATLRPGVRVADVKPEPGGVRVAAGDESLRVRLVIVACGATYGVQRRFGLGLPSAYVHTAQRELRAARRPEVELYFGRDVAPDGFAWAVPIVRPEGPFARIGVMASSDALGCYTRLVARIADRWGLVDDPTPPRQKILPLGAIDRTYAERLLVIGDAAGLVKPTTGGGIYYSILSARLAADVALHALRTDRLDAESLSAYERAWRSELADEFDAQHNLRDIVTALTDDEIDGFFELARTDGVMPIVRGTMRFNRHRDLIGALLRHPPARKILLRALSG